MYVHVADFGRGKTTGRLPVGVVAIRRGEAIGDSHAGAVGNLRAVQIALPLQHIADPAVADGQVALPVGVVAIRRGEALGDGHAGAVGGQRAVQIALPLQHIADPLVADGQVALPVGVVAIRRGEALGDGHAGAVGGQRAVQIAEQQARIAALNRNPALKLPADFARRSGELVGQVAPGQTPARARPARIRSTVATQRRPPAATSRRPV